MPEVDPAIRSRFLEALRRASLEERGPRAELTESERLAMTRAETAAGGPENGPEPDFAPIFEQRQRKLSTVDRGVYHFRRSEWVGELARARRPLDEALEVIRARVAEHPDEATLREAQIVLNDLGRLPGGGDLIGRRLTQAILDGLRLRGGR